ncbi:hypothetical protein S1361_25470 [Streptomyces cyanogenus]|uniref:Uncharacterized protein n=1 Tax=Streptomyces cyanogenus TaxID=80860 RepID=A0ABX7TWP4_STRCY|nr:hypothetical protein S1361_25470 [Streptomyces cyanogenus]
MQRLGPLGGGRPGGSPGRSDTGRRNRSGIDRSGLTGFTDIGRYSRYSTDRRNRASTSGPGRPRIRSYSHSSTGSHNSSGTDRYGLTGLTDTDRSGLTGIGRYSRSSTGHNSSGTDRSSHPRVAPYGVTLVGRCGVALLRAGRRDRCRLGQLEVAVGSGVLRYGALGGRGPAGRCRPRRSLRSVHRRDTVPLVHALPTAGP